MVVAGGVFQDCRSWHCLWDFLTMSMERKRKLSRRMEDVSVRVREVRGAPHFFFWETQFRLSEKKIRAAIFSPMLFSE